MADDLDLRIRLKADGSGLIGEFKRGEQVVSQFGLAADQLDQRARRGGAGLNLFSRGAGEASRASRDLGGQASSLSQGFGILSRALPTLSVIALASQLTSVNREFQKLNAQLVTVTGSNQAANDEFLSLQKFAKETPYQLNEVVQSFIKLQNLGLRATEADLRSYGNTASAMGKSLDQMIEAVADASVGEFERLKEFGIKARVEGDKVSLTFRGVTKTIKNDSDEITQYLTDIGNNQFASGMDQQMKTLDGALSNLSDSWDQLFFAIGESTGFSERAAGGVRTIAEALDSLSSFISSGALFDELTIQADAWLEVLGLSETELEALGFAADESLGAVADILQAIAEIGADAFLHMPANARLSITHVIAWFDQLLIRGAGAVDRLALNSELAFAKIKATVGFGDDQAIAQLEEQIRLSEAKQAAAISGSEAAVKAAQEERDALVDLTNKKRESAAAGRDEEQGKATSEREERLAKERESREKQRGQAAQQRQQQADEEKQTKLNESLQKELRTLEQHTGTAEQLENDRYQKALATMQAAKAAGVESIRGYQVLEQQLEAQHQEELKQIREKAENDKVQAENEKRQNEDQKDTDRRFLEIAAAEGRIAKDYDVEKSGQLRKEVEEQKHQDQLRAIRLKHAGEYGDIVEQFVDMDRASGADRVSIALDIGEKMFGAAAGESKKAFELQKAFRIGQAVVSAYTAITNAMADLPYPANIAASVAIGVQAFANIRKIQSQKFEGGRMFGGGVSAQGFVEVGEHNRPELFKQDGKLLLFPGNRGGQVIPLGGAGPAVASGAPLASPQVVVNLFNAPPGAEVRQNGNQVDVIWPQVQDRLAQDMVSGADWVKAGESTYGWNRATGSRVRR